MAYCTITDLEARLEGGMDTLIELSDQATPPTGALNTVVVNAAIDDAAAMIDSYLASRYTLPFASVPRMLRKVNVDIALPILAGKRAKEQMLDDRDAALKWLKDVAAGTASIGIDASNNVVKASSGGPQIVAPDRVFTQALLADFTK